MAELLSSQSLRDAGSFEKLSNPWAPYLASHVVSVLGANRPSKVLLIHGHAKDRLELKDWLEHEKLADPVVMGTEFTAGQTLPEKFEDLANEADARMIGYGGMLMEGVVGIVALIAATSLFPGDYFAINTAQATPTQQVRYAQMVETHTAEGFDLQPKEIDRLEAESGEKNLRGRTGGAVTLALGIAKIFDGVPGLAGLMKYWYHFAIMFEALFILTTIDTGTRVGRFLVGEFMVRFYKSFEEPKWVPGS